MFAYGESVYTDVISEDRDSASHVDRYIGQFSFDLVLVLSYSVFLCAVLLCNYIPDLVQQCFKLHIKVYFVSFRVCFFSNCCLVMYGRPDNEYETVTFTS